MTPKERADDIMGRCWWRPEEHPGELRPLFAGLGPEIEAAIREAVAETKEAAAMIATTKAYVRCQSYGGGTDGACGVEIAALIRAMKEAE